jgi:hypothetical protein
LRSGACRDDESRRPQKRRSALPLQSDGLGPRRLHQVAIERRQLYPLPLGQLQVSGVINRKPMRPGQAQHFALFRRAVQRYRQPSQLLKEDAAVSLREPFAALIHHQDVSHLEPPQGGGESLIDTQPDEGQIGLGVIFVPKGPASCDRGVDDEGHSGFTPFFARGEDLLSSDAGGVAAPRFDARDGVDNICLPAICFGHQPGDGMAMPRDDHRFAALDLIEQLGKAGLGLGSLDLSHKDLTGQLNQSNIGRPEVIVKWNLGWAVPRVGTVPFPLPDLERAHFSDARQWAGSVLSYPAHLALRCATDGFTPRECDEQRIVTLLVVETAIDREGRMLTITLGCKLLC